MNFQPLFTSARVVSAFYKLISTTILLCYLGKRIVAGRRITRSGLKGQAVKEFLEE